jgi:hypothetical protein
MTIANLLGLVWVMFGGFVGFFTVRHRTSQTGRFAINLMVAMIYIIFGVVVLLFGQKMDIGQQWMFVVFTLAAMYVTWAMLQLSRD